MYKAYASYFVSYLIASIKELENIERIVLFGSAARDEAKGDSDIDIFVELKKEGKKHYEEIDKITEDFYKSREALLFRAKGVDNKINVIAGKIENWKELRGSIESNGILLYGRYVASGVSGTKHAIIFWDKVGKNRGAFLNKLYGFKANEKRYQGLIEKLNGKKTGKSSILIPTERKEEILHLIKEHKVNAKILEVWV